MKLYHISNNLFKPIEYFNPRIPHNTMENEDDTIKRVSFCDSIEGCLSAIPGVGS